MTYTKLTKSQLDEMQFDVGVLVRSFNLSDPAINAEDVLCATSGGISLSIVPEYTDISGSVYMMASGTKELLYLDGWTVEAEFTTITESADMLTFALGAVDTTNGIKPRDELKATDFGDVWWIGNRLDNGLVAVRFINALSDNGITLTAEHRQSGKIDVHIMAHGTLEDDANAVPVEIYSIEGEVEHPEFSIINHMYLIVDNIYEDVVTLNESTGEMTVEQNSYWNYNLDEDTGMMEVSY